MTTGAAITSANDGSLADTKLSLLDFGLQPGSEANAVPAFQQAVAEAKKLVRRVPFLSREDGFAETVPWSAKLFASEEGAEGMAAFREKRKPNWVKD